MDGELVNPTHAYSTRLDALHELEKHLQARGQRLHPPVSPAVLGAGAGSQAGELPGQRLDLVGVPPASTVTAGEWPLRSGLALGALPTAVPCARLHAKHVLWEWRLDQLAETVELLVSELVTNAVRAVSQLNDGPPIRLRLLSDKKRVLIEVWDGDSRPPVPKGLAEDGIPALGDESGRGLFLVATLSNRWDWFRTRELGGKVVWAEVGERSD